jgi:putative transposase
MVFHRPIPTGFKVKTGTVIREADGWYISLTLAKKEKEACGLTVLR